MSGMANGGRSVSPYQSNPIIVNITAAQTYQSVPFTTPSKSQVTVANSDSNQPSTTTKTAGTNAPAQASDVVIVQNQNVLGANSAAPNQASTPGANQTQPSVLMQVRTSTLPTRIPNTSLYRIRPQSTSNYLVETDPQFTQLKTWLGSDYLLKSLSVDPTITQKRLGDGYYEQKLIREQVARGIGLNYLAAARTVWVCCRNKAHRGDSLRDLRDTQPNLALAWSSGDILRATKSGASERTATTIASLARATSSRLEISSQRKFTITSGWASGP